MKTGWCWFTLLTFLWLCMLPRPTYANNYPQTSAEPPGEGVIIAQGAKQYNLPLESTDVKISITSMIASVNVEQLFGNPYNENLEATYIFPLPGEAAVDRMDIVIGSRLITGAVKKQTEAIAEYEDAINSGQQAGLLLQQSANVFVIKIGNILPGEKITARLHYTQVLNYDDGSFRLSFPLVVAPRYQPYSDNTARLTAPLLPATERVNTAKIEVALAAGLTIKDITSPSHQIETYKNADNTYLVKLASTSTLPNRDFILEYKVAGDRPQALLMKTDLAKEGYFVLLAIPPVDANRYIVQPKQVTLVIDTSGSMEGNKLTQAKKALLTCLDSLNEKDYFNVVNFESEYHYISDEPLPATQGNLNRARTFIESLQADGGTEMLAPLRFALAQGVKKVNKKQSSNHSSISNLPGLSATPIKRELLPIVVFFTDGQVANESEILAEVKKNSETRVFAFGIDTAVNEYFLRKMARLGRGEAEFLLPEQRDISPQMERFRKRLSSPIAKDLKLNWVAPINSKVFPAQLPDLFINQPVIIVGKVDGTFLPKITIDGLTADGQFSIPVDSTFQVNNIDGELLAILWARYYIEDLNDQLLNGKDAEKIKDLITAIALKYQMISPFTSFVAVDTSHTVGTTGVSVTVPVMMPAGWQSNISSLPKLDGKKFVIPVKRSAKRSPKKADRANKTPEVHSPQKEAEPQIANEPIGKITFLPAKPEPAKPLPTRAQALINSSRPNANNGSITASQPTTSSSSSPFDSPQYGNNGADQANLTLTNRFEVINHLLDQQLSDGSWQDQNEDNLRTTALVVWALMENGYFDGKNPTSINMALRFLSNSVISTGQLTGIKDHQHYTEIHALVLYVMAAHLETNDNLSLRDKVQALYNYLLNLVGPDGLYLNEQDGMNSWTATAFVSMALKQCVKVGFSDNKLVVLSHLNVSAATIDDDYLARSFVEFNVGGKIESFFQVFKQIRAIQASTLTPEGYLHALFAARLVSAIDEQRSEEFFEEMGKMELLRPYENRNLALAILINSR